MDAIIAQNQRETGDVVVVQVDSVRADALKVVDYYLGLPVTKYNEGTYSFWRDYSDKAQKGLCKLARIHLTPPPTSTGIILVILSLF